MTDEIPSGTKNWALLVDPAWQAAGPDDTPPPDMMDGGWMLDADGVPGRFQQIRPTSPPPTMV